MSAPAARDHVLSLTLPEPPRQLESVAQAAPVAFGDDKEAVSMGAQAAEFSDQMRSAQADNIGKWTSEGV